MTIPAIEEEALNLGWNLDSTTIAQVVGFLESLGLVAC